MALFNLCRKIRSCIAPSHILVLLAVVLRMVPHTPNFTATGAASIYSGRYFKGPTKYIIPLAILLTTDLFLGFHKTMPFVYFCFVINILLGVWISKKPTVLRILGTTILASTIFFIVTNFGVWLVGGLYPASVQGLALCYINAIPFARNTLLGDLVFVGALFGLTELIKKYHNVSSLERRKYQEVEIIRSNLSSDNKLS